MLLISCFSTSFISWSSVSRLRSFLESPPSTFSKTSMLSLNCAWSFYMWFLIFISTPAFKSTISCGTLFASFWMTFLAAFYIFTFSKILAFFNDVFSFTFLHVLAKAKLEVVTSLSFHFTNYSELVRTLWVSLWYLEEEWLDLPPQSFEITYVRKVIYTKKINTKAKKK